MRTPLFLPLLMIAITSFLPLCLVAQENKHPLADNELFKNKSIFTMAYGGVTTEFSTIDNQLGVFPGVTVGAILNRKIIIGGYFSALMSPVKIQGMGEQNYDLRFEQGGLWVGHLFNTRKKIYWGVSTRIGKGDIRISKNMLTVNKDRQVLVLYPQADIGINIFRWMRFHVNASYRVTGDFNLPEINKAHLNTFNTSFGILFGECGNSYCF